MTYQFRLREEPFDFSYEFDDYENGLLESDPGLEAEFDEFETAFADLEEEEEARRGPRAAGSTIRGHAPPVQLRRPPPRRRRPPRTIIRPWRVSAGVIHEPSTCTCPEQTCPQHGSEYIRWVQSTLNRILGMRLPLNGVLTPATRSAIRSFQEREKLPVTGIVGPDTERALIAARSGQSPGAGATKPDEPGMTEPPEPAATLPEPGMTEPAEPAPTSPVGEFDFEWERFDDEFEDAEGLDETDLEWLDSEWEETIEPEIVTPTGAVAAKGVLKRAGLTTEKWVDQKAPALIQAAVEQSRVLRPFIANKLGKITISKNYHHYGSDAEFVYAYLKLNKIVAPPQEEKRLTDNVRAFYHRPTDSIRLRPRTHFGEVLQLAIIKFSSPGFGGFFGESLAKGAGLYFTNLVLEEQGLERMKSVGLKDQLSCATDLVGVVGLNLVGKAYFQNHSDLLNHLTTKLSIGPVRTEELARDALCKTPPETTAPLLRTARFASHLVRNMVGVGITEPRSVRLWMRTDVPGIHELQILRGSSATRSVRVEVPAGQAGDNTAVIPYPGSTRHPPLDPLTRYRYRIVRTSDGEPLGEGSFETPPGRDGDTPQKVVIGLLSCHQPFTDRGTISPEADRMLRVLPRILRENDVKFVLPCGDQMYADEPGIFSLFKNPCLIRQAFPDRKAVPKNIFECTDKEVRRLYDLRYRMFWSMPAIRKMYANYPCYPTMDDHEIKNGWGTDPEHSGSKYKNVLRGALDAYRDYQVSSVLPPRALGMRKSGSFHYDFSYGNIGVFVMDIRSQRYNLLPRGRQMFSQAQFDDLRLFLRNNSHKKVLLIVSSVPVVFVPGVLADTSRRLHIKESNFVDHWSHPANVPARDAFLSLLHAHQQAHPNQRVALACGDVHIGNAFGIHWQGGRNPWLYQFTSSALTALETRTTQFLVEKAPRLVSGVTCPSTPFGGPCSAQVSHLPAANEASSHNPFVGLNLGLIEVQRHGEVSNLKFKLIGYHPKEDRPVTYFESGWLG